MLNLHQKALDLFKQGRSRTAIKIMHQALAMDPGNTEFHNDLGVLYFHTGKEDKASGLFQRAIELDDTQIDARKNLADLYAAAGRTTEAETLYKEILDRHPNDAETLATLGNLRKETKSIDGISAKKTEVSEILDRNDHFLQNNEECLQVNPDKQDIGTILTATPNLDLNNIASNHEDILTRCKKLKIGFLS